jgi:hypothetical protein
VASTSDVGRLTTIRQLVTPAYAVPGCSGKICARMPERSPSAPTTRSAFALVPSAKTTRPNSGSTSVTSAPSVIAPSGAADSRVSSRAARCRTTVGLPNRSSATSALVRDSQPPLRRWMPASPCRADSSRTVAPRPIESSAVSALGPSASPAPAASIE